MDVQPEQIRKLAQPNCLDARDLHGLSPACAVAHRAISVVDPCVAATDIPFMGRRHSAGNERGTLLVEPMASY
jgi:hypothetical protein